MDTIIDAHLHLNKNSNESNFAPAIARLNSVLTTNGIDKALIIALLLA